MKGVETKGCDSRQWGSWKEKGTDIGVFLAKVTEVDYTESRQAR